MTDLKNLYNFMAANKNKIESFKITHFEKVGFNEMEGGIYQINVKVITTEKYRNKLIKVLTNSTYLENFYNDGIDDEDWTASVKENLIDWLSTSFFRKSQKNA